MANIKQIISREILTATGIPTIEATVVLNDNSLGTASYPLPSHLDRSEPVILTDGDPNRFEGRGVQKAMQLIETTVAPALVNKEANNQREIDKILIELDGTENKSRLGANTTLAVSMAVAKAAALANKTELYSYLKQYVSSATKAVNDIKIPTPLFSFLHGFPGEPGLVNFEEFLIVPASSKTYGEALILATKLFAVLKQILHENNILSITTNVGGLAPKLPVNIDALSLLSQAFERSLLRLGLDSFIGIDFHAENFYRNNQYRIPDKTQSLSANALNDYYQEITKQYRVLYLEDPFSNNDWDTWTSFTKKISLASLVAADALTTSNLSRLQMALEKQAAGAIVVKPSQIGTVIESLAFAEIVHEAGLKVVISQRTKETNDDFIADFAVAVSADYVRFGSMEHGEHVAKYNRLLEIEKQLTT